MTVTSDTILEDFLSGGPMTTVDIVDCHVHLGPALYMMVPNSDPAGMVGVLDAMGVAVACVSHSVGMVSDWKLGNDLLIQAREQFPGRIWGYTFCNPRYPADLAAEMERCAAAGLQGLKIHPDFHNTPADSPLYDPVYEYASEEHRVLLCHYGAGFGPRAGSHLYRTVVERFPRLACIMAHSLPSTGAVDTAVEYFGSRQNVWFCLANAFQPGVVEYAARKLGAERLLYGSDGCWGAMEPRLGMVCCTELDERSKRMILGENMRGIMSSHPAPEA